MKSARRVPISGLLRSATAVPPSERAARALNQIGSVCQSGGARDRERIARQLTSTRSSRTRHSTGQNQSWDRTSSTTARRMISGLVLHNLNGSGLVLGKRCPTPQPVRRRVCPARPLRPTRVPPTTLRGGGSSGASSSQYVTVCRCGIASVSGRASAGKYPAPRRPSSGCRSPR